jgi:macrolide-specific efflux system membrane fusion protein
VAITYSSIPNAIQVPTLAVSTNNGTSTVVVRTNGHDETRTVTTGQRANGMVQITSGLTAGEQVVIRVPTFGNRTGADGNTGNRNGGTGGSGGFTFPGGNGGPDSNGKGG